MLPGGRELPFGDGMRYGPPRERAARYRLGMAALIAAGVVVGVQYLEDDLDWLGMMVLWPILVGFILLISRGGEYWGAGCP